MGFTDINISVDSANPSALGFGTPLLLSADVDAAFAGDRARVYTGLDGVAADCPSKTSPTYLFAQGLFAQTPRPKYLVVGRLANKPTMVYLISALLVAAGATYKLPVDGDGVTSTDVAVTLPASDITVSAVANASDQLSAASAHSMATGDGPYRMKNVGGALPAGSAADTDYWMIVNGANTWKLATSKANALAGTAVNLTDDGTGVHTLVRTSNNVLMALVKDRLNAVANKNYTVVQNAGVGDTDTLTATANAAGNWYSIGVDATQLVCNQVYADPGVAADLDAIQLANTDWYEVHSVYNSKAIVAAIAGWVESSTQPHRYEAETSNTLSVTAAAGGGGEDIGDAIKALAYKNTRVTYYERPQRMFAARQTGRIYSLDPGQVDANWKTVAGAEASKLTATHKANLLAKNMSFYTTEKGVPVTAGGTMADGEWWDVRRSLDAVKDQLEVEFLRVRLSNDIVPYTNGGLASFEAPFRAVIGVNTIEPGTRDKAIFADTPAPVFTIPRVEDALVSDRAARRAGPLSCQARLAGSINELVVNLNVTL